jgi:hypothetical protein
VQGNQAADGHRDHILTNVTGLLVEAIGGGAAV